ncbi:MAG TPA: type II toxin-antitoxin system prevent-host-death family antitoxin [Polyangiales bacterium]|nr:type II toxin-antitoxin system prevent-host-death family antitoxin [Polyangiales bacterium]
MKQVNVHEAKTQLSKLLEEVEAGGTVVIARAGVPVARLTPYTMAGTARRVLGGGGRVVMREDFDALPPDVAAAFEGGDL